MPWLELPADRPGLRREHTSVLLLSSRSQPPPQTESLCAAVTLFESLQLPAILNAPISYHSGNWMLLQIAVYH